MDFAELKSGIKCFGLDCIRVDNELYFEAVFKKKEMVKLKGLLEKELGMPVWPSREGLSKGSRQLADSHGGLRSGQAFFYCTKDGVRLFAMLWPWQDGERITIKFGRA